MLTSDVVFDGIDLLDSIILGWAADDASFTVTLEASLHPSHPLATEPAPGERACFLSATLHFAGVTALSGLTDQSPDSAEDWDTVHCLRTDCSGKYYLEGDLGEVHIVADTVSLSLDQGGRPQQPRFVA